MVQRYLRAIYPSDVEYVSKHMRRADRDEILAEGNFTPDQALRYSVENSDVSLAGIVGEEPVILFGLYAPLVGEVGTIWALGTDACDRNPIAMVKFGRKVVKSFLLSKNTLENYCDARYIKAHRWLEKLGFELGEPESYGAKGSLFRKLTIRKEI